MNLDERMEQSTTYNSFRTSLDIGMGAIYVIMSVVLFSMRYFGAIELSPTKAYLLGSLLALYGAFRIYRGITGIKQRKSATTRESSKR
jgi:hypothetical protein